MGYLAFNLSSKYLQFSKFSVRDIAPRDRYRRAIWVISSDIAPRDQYRRAIWGVLSDVAARFDRFDDFAGVLIVTRWGHSPYEMGAFPLQDEQISISSADRNEKLARASAYPLGWASGQVLLSSGVGCLQIS